MEQYNEVLQEGYLFAKEELVDRLSEVEGLDDWTIDQICNMIESNKL